MDKEWIINFAKTAIGKGNGIEVNASSDNVNTSVQQKIRFICSDLYELAKTAVETFNLYSENILNLKLFSRNHSDQSGLCGFYLLVKSSRAHIYLNAAKNLCVELDTINGYHLENKGLYVFSPFIDYYGVLLWKSEDLTLLSQEHVLKFALEKLLVIIKSE